MNRLFSDHKLPPCELTSSCQSELSAILGRTRFIGRSNIPSGYIYLGQFIAHDLSHSGKNNRYLELETVYGDGFNDPQVAVDKLTGTMMIGKTIASAEFSESFNDLPRHSNKSPWIKDERNEENLIIAQLHLQFLKAHNYFVHKIDQDAQPYDVPPKPEELFESARQQLIHHYQQIVLFDFLYTVMDPDCWHAIIFNESELDTPTKSQSNSFIVKQACLGAAFRFGHTAIRPKYVINEQLRGTELDLIEILQLTGRGGLKGHERLPQQYCVDWRMFFNIPFTPPPSKFNLARPIAPSVNPLLSSIPCLSHGNLATRDIKRNKDFRLPSAQSLIRRLREVSPQLSQRLQLKLLGEHQLNIPVTLRYSSKENQQHALGLQSNVTQGETRLLDALANANKQQLISQTPLWYYFLVESQALHQGRALGTLASIVLGQTIKDNIRNSSLSILASKPSGPRYIKPSKEIYGQLKTRFLDLLMAVDPSLNSNIPKTNTNTNTNKEIT